jgi:hypothetical protein
MTPPFPAASRHSGERPVLGERYIHLSRNVTLLMIRRSLRRVVDSLGTPLRLSQAPEFFGPTDINAQSGNQRLSVALSRTGTVAVLRWPRPSYFNQVAHHTTDRDAPRCGAHPNEGAFLGLGVTTDEGTETTWLRDWDVAQRYADDASDAVVTTHRHDDYGLVVEVTDVVAADADVFVRALSVERAVDSPVADVRVLAYANLDLTVSKRPWSPTQDLTRRWNERGLARYHADVDAVVFSKTGVDESTDEDERVAIAVGFGGGCDAVHVGGDDQQPGAGVGPRDAYAAATAGDLSGNRSQRGKTTAVLARRLDFDTPADATGAEAGTTAATTVLFAAAPTVEGSRRLLDEARGWEPATVRDEKRAWFDSLLADAPLPATDDPVVLAVARRALVTLVTNYDPETGAVVAAISSQSPYAQDWPRDGAFCNHVLDRIGRSDWARKRNRWYASLQERRGRRLLGHPVVPAGNWAMNYYGDGVEAGPIPWEIDQTAFAVWTLWDHYRSTGGVDGREYLREVYPAIRRAADFLAGFRDPATGLHRAAHEDDNVVHSRTIVGASTVWLALDSAVRAAHVLGEDADRERYRRRRDELAAAIDTHLWCPVEGAYSRGRSLVHRLLEHPVVPEVVQALPILPGTRGVATLAWPAAFTDTDDPRMRRHLDHVWASVAPSFDEPDAGARSFGMYETKALIALARAWRGRPEAERVRDGVRWVAHEHATSDTHVLGEAWVRRGGAVVAAVSQPHTFTGLLFYYASLEAFSPAGWDPAENQSGF